LTDQPHRMSVSAPLQPGRRPYRALRHQPLAVCEGTSWLGRSAPRLYGATLARASKIMAPTSCFTGQVHKLPDAPQAYGAMITRAKAAPPQSRSTAFALASPRLSISHQTRDRRISTRLPSFTCDYRERDTSDRLGRN
jgi:hypothetical protein